VISAHTWLNSALRPLGIRIERARPKGWPVANAAQSVTSLIDVGCAFGTPDFYALRKDASLLLVDPVAEYLPWIEKILARRPGKHAITALGARAGEILLNVDLDAPTRSSALSRTALTRTGGRVEQRRVPVVTLDSLVESLELRPPFGLKIDTEGYELEVLRGATQTLSKTEILIAEISVLPRFERSYSFLELLQYLDGAGFEIHRVLTANRDPQGLIRFLDVAFVPKRERTGRG
jgi:FkbM family methyltransferase